MMNEISIISLNQLINKKDLSPTHIDEATNFTTNDQKSQQSLYEDWDKNFQYAKGNNDVDKVIVFLLIKHKKQSNLSLDLKQQMLPLEMLLKNISSKPSLYIKIITSNKMQNHKSKIFQKMGKTKFFLNQINIYYD